MNTYIEHCPISFRRSCIGFPAIHFALMNTKASVAYGWAALTVFGVGGSYLGWRSVQADKTERITENRERLHAQRKQAALTIERLKRKKRMEAESNEALQQRVAAQAVRPPDEDAAHGVKDAAT